MKKLIKVELERRGEQYNYWCDFPVEVGQIISVPIKEILLPARVVQIREKFKPTDATKFVKWTALSTLPLAVSQVRDRKQSIFEARGDYETAHQLEDELYEDFIRHVAALNLGGVSDMAKCIIETKSIPFNRYCA